MLAADYSACGSITPAVRQVSQLFVTKATRKMKQKHNHEEEKKQQIPFYYSCVASRSDSFSMR